MYKYLKNRFFLNFAILFSYTFILEMIVRLLTNSSFNDYANLRILISTGLISFFISWLGQLLPKLGQRILNIIFLVFYGLYTFIEFGLYNFIGFFMGVGNADQGTKVLGFIGDFLNSLKPVYWLILLPLVIYLIYYIFIDKKVVKSLDRPLCGNRFLFNIACVVVMCAVGVLYYNLATDTKFQNKLQTESNKALWLYPENSNLAVNNYGVVVYGFCDLKSIILNINEDDVLKYNSNNKKEEEKKEEEPVTDYSRVIDDTAWNQVISETTNNTYNTLNNYFINRSITPKNEKTGLFKGKNLIIILMESTNEIPIMNSEYFPTINKMYNEGMTFRNNFTPRNCCSTGNNEFTALTSLFTINSTCTANTYANNKYFEAVYNIFNKEGYYTSAYHDYTGKYYKRATIHPNLGAQKYLGVTGLGIAYKEAYEEWPSDVLLMQKSQPHYMTQEKFMTYMASVTPHQTYYQPSEMGDKYKKYFKDLGYSTSLARYLSKEKVFDEALAELLHELEESGKLDDTVIALFGDHFPYGLTDSQINEYLEKNNANYRVNRNSTKEKNVDRTPLIIYNSQIEPTVIDSYTTIIDLMPTLLNLFDMDYDPRLYMGTDIFSEEHKSLAAFSDGSWQTEKGFYYAPSSKITYFDEANTYTDNEIRSITSDVKERQKMSALAIKNNYFNYLGKALDKNLNIQSEVLESEVQQEQNAEGE